MSPPLSSLDHHALRPRLGILLAAALFSTGGAAIKTCGLTGWQVASFRSGIAALFLVLALPGARRGWNRTTLLLAAAYASTLVLFVQANKLTTAASAIFLQSAAPLYVLVAGHFLLKERFRRADLVFMAALALGLALLFIGTERPAATAPDPVLGNMLATLSGVFWGLTIVGLRWAGRGRASGDDAGIAPVALGNLLAFAVGQLWVWPIAHGGPVDWLVVAYLGLVQIGVAYVFLTRSFRRVRALEASLLLLFEPVLNPIWAWILQRERPGLWVLVGGGIVLGATLLNALRRGLEDDPPPVNPVVEPTARVESRS